MSATPREPEKPPKRGLFARLAGAMDEIVAAAEKTEVKVPAAPPPAAPATPVAPARSGPLPASGRAASLRLPGPGGSGPLPAVTTRVPVAPPPPESGVSAEEARTRSRRRMAFIVTYMKDPLADPDFANTPLVYRVFADERDHQDWLATGLEAELARLAPDDPRRAELEHERTTARNRARQLAKQMKKLVEVPPP